MKLGYLLLLLTISTGAYCQSIKPSVVANAGDVFKSGAFSIEWTLGELATETIVGGAHKITQGFHQGNFIISSIGDSNLSGLDVYPNPFSSELHVVNSLNQTLSYKLIGVNGIIELTGKFSGGNQSFNLEHLQSGTYILQIVSDASEANYQILKIK